MVWEQVEKITQTRISNRGFNGVDVYQGRVLIGTLTNNLETGDTLDGERISGGFRLRLPVEIGERRTYETPLVFRYSEQVRAVEYMKENAKVFA